MENKFFELDSLKPFSESLLWQLNRDYYQGTGIDGWRDGTIPFQLTSSSIVGKTYAELILGFLKDVASKGQLADTVYILELGAGHGRLAFHILKHLDNLISLYNIELPPYCYILSDIVDDNLSFYKNHPQLQTYFDSGRLDFAYFDAIGNKEIQLQYSNRSINAQNLKQPLVAIANYFFDSIPTDVFLIQDKKLLTCEIELQSTVNPDKVDTETLIKHLQVNYQKTEVGQTDYPQDIINELLEEYKQLLTNSHVFFPHKGMECLINLTNLSSEGLLVLSMDKGFHDIKDLDHIPEPEIITHGSFSLWVNYHALGAFCLKKGGKILFPTYSTFHAEIGCLFFLAKAESYQYTNGAYQRYINDFGPDDFNSLKKMTYSNISKLKLSELIALLRLSAYDSTFFRKVLPRLKQMAKTITHKERNRIAQTLRRVGHFYFNIGETNSLFFEIGGLFYDLGYYEDALDFYQDSVHATERQADHYHNQLLCYFQLRQDDLFRKTLQEAQTLFPEHVALMELDKLNLNAV